MVKTYKALFASTLFVCLLAAVWLRIEQSQVIQATNFSSFSVIQQDGSQRLLLSLTNTDNDTTIQDLQYNIGRGWISTATTLGTNYFNFNVYTEIPYSQLPINITRMQFRAIDSNNATYNLTGYIYPGKGAGCSMEFCPAGNKMPLNMGSDMDTVYVNSWHEDGFSGDSLNVSIDANGTDPFLVATIHYRGEFEQVSGIRHIYDDFILGCQAKSGEYSTEIWYLKGPELGMNDVTVNWTGNVDDAFVTIANFENVHQANPVSNTACNQDSGWANSHSLPIFAYLNQVVYGGATTYSGNFNDIVSVGFDAETVNVRQGNVSMAAGYQNGGPANSLNWENVDPGNLWPWSAAALTMNRVPLTDSTVPVMNITSSPSGTIGGSFDIIGSASEDSLVIHSVIAILTNTDTLAETQYLIDAGDGTYDEGSESFARSFSGIPDGNYDIEIRAYNSDGYYGTETFSFSVSSDNEDPVVSVSNFGQAPTTDTTPSWTGSATDNVQIASAEFMVYDVDIGYDEVTWTPVTITSGSYGTGSIGFSFTSPSLTDGVKEILVRVTDANGNDFSETVDRVVIQAVDNASPIIRAKDIFPNPTPDPEPKFTIKVIDDTSDLVSDIAAFYYNVDSAGWELVTPLDGAFDESIEEFEVTLTGLSLGAHSVVFRAVDTEGNDTNSTAQNITKNFTIIAQPGGLSPQNYTSTLNFNSDAYIDFDQSENLIWGNGRLRLAEEMTPVATPLITSATDFGPKYGTSQGAWQIDPSETNGFWVTKSNGKFSYYDLTSDTETEFDLFDYYGTNQVAYDVREMRSGSNYHVWVAAGTSIFGMNLGTSITDTSDDTWVIRENPGFAQGTNILEVSDLPGYGLYYSMENGLNFINAPVFPNSVDNSIPVYSRELMDGFQVHDITEIYSDGQVVWVAEYTQGVSKIYHNGAPQTVGSAGSEVIALYSSYVGIFDIGKDKDDLPFFIGAGGLHVVTEDGGTFGDASDDTIVNVADNSNLNSNVGAVGRYLEGTFPVESQYFVANRTGEMFYVSTNGTYSDQYDDQILKLHLTDVYPTSVRDFYMINEDEMIVVLEKLGVYHYDLGRLFEEQGFATTNIDSQVANYLNADFIKLDNFVRIDSTDAVVTYMASNTAGTTVFTLTPGDTLNLPDQDYRVALRIDMFRGSTPVLTSVTFSYSAYPDAGPELDEIVTTGIPSSITSGQGFNFDINTLDQLGNPIFIDDVATIELRRSSDNTPVTFSHANATITEGEGNVIGASANVVGNHYLVITIGGVTYTSSPISFIAPVTPPPPPPPASNGGGNNGGSNGGGFLDQVSNQASQLPGSPTNPSTGTGSGSQPSTDPVIKTFEVVETVEDGQVKLVITWEVLNAEYVEISGVGEQLPARGRAEIYVDSDTVIQILGIGKDGEQAFKNYRVTGVEEKIAAASAQAEAASNTAPILPLLIALALAGIAFFGELASSGNLFFIPAFYFKHRKQYSGVVYDASTRSGLSGVNVELYRGTKLVAQATSDAKGRYLLQTPNSGEFTVIVRNPGFNEFAQKLTSANVEYVGLDINLQRRLGAEEAWQFNKPGIISLIQIISLISLVVGLGWSIITLLSGFSVLVFVLALIYGFWLVMMFISGSAKRV